MAEQTSEAKTAKVAVYVGHIVPNKHKLAGVQVYHRTCVLDDSKYIDLPSTDKLVVRSRLHRTPAPIGEHMYSVEVPFTTAEDATAYGQQLLAAGWSLDAHVTGQLQVPFPALEVTPEFAAQLLQDDTVHHQRRRPLRERFTARGEHERNALQDAINVGAVYAWLHALLIEFAHKTDITSAAFGNGTPAWCPLETVPVFTDPSLLWRVPDSQWVAYPVQLGQALPAVYRWRHKTHPHGWSIRVGRHADRRVTETMAEFHEYQVLNIE